MTQGSNPTKMAATMTAGDQDEPALRVDMFHYAMDGVYTGDLFVCHHAQRQVSWRSSRTQLSTAWHGHWRIENNVLHIEFDYLGRNMGKFLDVDLATLRGFDYRAREIVLKRGERWVFDSDCATYVMYNAAAPRSGNL